MVKRMLIDATHPEETRVVVVSGTRLDELDVETSTKKQLKGNVYLAKVVRVEPSLQAAFVEYGGNRHGFLAFGEIHPDYYQIPVADRQALLAEQKEVMRDGNGHPDAGEDGEGVESVGGDDVEEVEPRRPRSLRNYKIQEVIKRRQILLVQVVKEERGNKGAALTTYLSLAGRYCVLMPNTARGGGVSRKITSIADRKRLKSVANELDIPEGMAVIVRTAGSERTKSEIKRDYDYLLRLWIEIVETTKKSIAPALVHEEGNLIKRSIRDLYTRDIDEILVEGDEGYRIAKDFMRMLTPSHAKRVQPYRDPVMPLFYRFQVESQLDAMHSPIVQLKSGGYIVISQTEALVAIDVNSGRSTKERHIEETALKTNLEASDEIARQLRLRDLAGLIVIDFIDMEENRNNHSVERRLKEAMKMDRARIQLGRISPFGLLELSRQRLRPSLIETSFQPCIHCAGTGQIRSVESTAIYILRAIEEEGIRQRSSEVTVTTPTSVALYILNQKRSALAEIESRYDFSVLLDGDDSLVPPNYRMERVKAEPKAEGEEARAIEAPAAIEPVEEPVEEAEEAEAAEAAEAGTKTEAESEADQEASRKRRKRRKRRRRPEDGQAEQPRAEQPADAEAEGEEPVAVEAMAEPAGEAEPAAEGEAAEATGEDHGPDGEHGKKRRRGRRGGRRRRREDRDEAAAPEAEAETAEAPAPELVAAAETAADTVTAEIASEATIEPAETSEPAESAPMESAPAEAAEAPPEAVKPKRRRKTKAETKAEAEAKAAEQVAEKVAETPKPKRRRKTKAQLDAEKAAAAEAAQQAPAEAAEPEPAPAEAAEPQPAEPEAPLAAEPSPETEAAPAVEAVATAEEAAETTEDRPRRRGWWQQKVAE